MATFNDLFQNNNDMLQYLEDEDNNNNKQTPHSQLYNFTPPIDVLSKDAQKKTKHPRTNYEAGFVMKGDITDNKSLSSVPVSNCDQSVNTSKYSRRITDYPEVLLTWDETAKRGLTRDEQEKVYERLRTKFGIGKICFYSDKPQEPSKTLMHIQASDRS